MNKKGFMISLALGFILAIIVGFGIYYFWANGFNFGIGDGDNEEIDCGLLDESERGECCEKKNEEKQRIQCVGEWKYVENECKFECEADEIVFCTQDAKDCGNGVFVSRDPSNNCQFPECPN